MKKLNYCVDCENLTKTNMKIRLNGKTLKVPMCEDCQAHAAIEILNDIKRIEEKYK